jgi:Fe-S cluster biogenesis protein NfuA
VSETTHNHEVNVSREQKVRELVQSLSAYIEQYHGGSVEMIGLDKGTLQVELGGACEGCSLSTATLKGWIGGTVRQFFPEITEVVEV